MVASASSCHMLTFLYLAANAGYNIASYEDNAVGEMASLDDGRQWLAKITLDPQIEWLGDTIPTDGELAKLHHDSHEMCYIANSIKSEIIVSGI